MHVILQIDRYLLQKCQQCSDVMQKRFHIDNFYIARMFLAGIFPLAIIELLAGLVNFNASGYVTIMASIVCIILSVEGIIRRFFKVWAFNPLERNPLEFLLQPFRIPLAMGALFGLLLYMSEITALCIDPLATENGSAYVFLTAVTGIAISIPCCLYFSSCTPKSVDC